MSTAMSQANLRLEANIAVMDHIKNYAKVHGEQLIEMMQQVNQSSVPHPTLGNKIDISL